MLPEVPVSEATISPTWVNARVQYGDKNSATITFGALLSKKRNAQDLTVSDYSSQMFKEVKRKRFAVVGVGEPVHGLLRT